MPHKQAQTSLPTTPPIYLILFKIILIIHNIKTIEQVRTITFILLYFVTSINIADCTASTNSIKLLTVK